MAWWPGVVGELFDVSSEKSTIWGIICVGIWFFLGSSNKSMVTNR